jgi:hypothetical protein
MNKIRKKVTKFKELYHQKEDNYYQEGDEQD